jgi:putative effector of murein hydrolase
MGSDIGWLGRVDAHFFVDNRVFNASAFASQRRQRSPKPAMTVNESAGWNELIRTPVFGLTLTIASYLAGRMVQKICRGNSLANPVFIAMLLVAGCLHITGTPYQAYYESTQLLTFLLGPATIALAIPLIKNIQHVKGRLARIFLALTAGSLVSALSGIGLVLACGGSRAVAFSMAPKAVTTPIAINIAQTVGGIPSLCAALAISGGILVAISIKWVLSWAGITDVRTFGFAAGMAGSGIGAAHALAFSELAGAFGALAVGFNGLVTPLIVLTIAHIWR